MQAFRLWSNLRCWGSISQLCWPWRGGNPSLCPTASTKHCSVVQTVLQGSIRKTPRHKTEHPSGCKLKSCPWWLRVRSQGTSKYCSAQPRGLLPSGIQGPHSWFTPYPSSPTPLVPSQNLLPTTFPPADADSPCSHSICPPWLWKTVPKMAPVIQWSAPPPPTGIRKDLNSRHQAISLRGTFFISHKFPIGICKPGGEGLRVWKPLSSICIFLKTIKMSGPVSFPSLLISAIVSLHWQNSLRYLFSVLTSPGFSLVRDSQLLSFFPYLALLPGSSFPTGEREGILIITKYLVLSSLPQRQPQRPFLFWDT